MLYTHTRTHTHIHARTRARTHTHTHTHSHKQLKTWLPSVGNSSNKRNRSKLLLNLFDSIYFLFWPIAVQENISILNLVMCSESVPLGRNTEALLHLLPLSRLKWWRSWFFFFLSFSFARIYWWSLFPLRYTSRNAEETREFKNENKKCSQGIWENSTKYII